MSDNLDRLLQGSREASSRGENWPDDLPEEIKELLRDSVAFRSKFVLLYHLIKISERPDDFKDGDIYEWSAYAGTLLRTFQGRERALVLAYFCTEDLPSLLAEAGSEGLPDEGRRAAEIERKLAGMTQLLGSSLKEASES